MNISDSLDLGKRQEMAATVNNQYQYHAIVMVSLFIIFHVKRRNSQLKTLVAMSRQLESAKSDKRLLQEEIDKKNRELAETKEQYAASSAEISSVKERLDDINRQLQQSQAELKSKEEMLASKMEQNRSFLSLLHKSELAGRAGDVLEAVKKSACGTKKMTAEDWRRIYAAINEIHPNFTSLLRTDAGLLSRSRGPHQSPNPESDGPPARHSVEVGEEVRMGGGVATPMPSHSANHLHKRVKKSSTHTSMGRF